MKVAFYIRFRDNAQEALNYYKEIFNAEEKFVQYYTENMTDDPNKIGMIYHAELEFNNFLFYLSDSFVDEDYRSFRLILEFDELSDAEHYFNVLSNKGKIHNKLEKIPIGPMVGLVEDKFGVLWNIVKV